MSSEDFHCRDFCSTGGRHVYPCLRVVIAPHLLVTAVPVDVAPDRCTCVTLHSQPPTTGSSAHRHDHRALYEENGVARTLCYSLVSRPPSMKTSSKPYGAILRVRLLLFGHEELDGYISLPNETDTSPVVFGH